MRERSLAAAARVLARRAGALPYLILMTDERRGGDPLAAAARLPAGALVILRHDGAPGREALARALARLCRSRRLRLSVARDARLALSLRAGLHLAEGMRPPAPFRLARRRGGRLLTIAAHGMAALARAHRLGADLALLSPLFPTVSHPGARPLGTLRFAGLARRARLPVAALGGVTARRVAAARAAGAAAVASVGALHGAATGMCCSPATVFPETHNRSFRPVDTRMRGWP